MYAISIYRLEEDGIKQIRYADYGYYLIATKTRLIIKNKHMGEAEDQFRDSGVSITVEGKRCLGAAVGT